MAGAIVPAVSDQEQSSGTLLMRLWRRWLRQHLGLILLNFLFIAVFSAVNGLYAPIIKYIVDGAAAGRTGMDWILLAALLVTIIKAASLLAHKRMNVRLFTQVSLDMQRELYAKMIEADLAWHGREPPAALAQRIMADVGATQAALERIVNNLIRDVLMIVAVVGSMIYIDWKLSLIALGIFPIAILPIAKIGQSLRKIGRQTQARIADVSARLLEGLTSIQIAKTYQLEDRLKTRSGRDLQDLRALQVRAGDHAAVIDPLMEVLGGLAVVGVLFFVGWRLEAGQNTLGDFAGFITALLLAGQPLRALGNLTAHVQRGLAGTQRVFNVLDEPPRIVDAPDAVELGVRDGEIALHEAGFMYADGTRALENVSLTVPGGCRLA
jgi:subfamily B ATP-binding cassette protein MsbA